ncbi:MAG: DUF5791 family protein [Haloarculaceae archaeon]
MIRSAFPDAGETSPQALLADYGRVLRETLEAHADGGPTDLDEDAISAVREGEPGIITLTEAASILALAPDRPDAATIATEARELLLMGMTTAVLDVERLAGAVDGELDPKEIQQKIEGRFPMDLEEYALLHHAIAAGSR